MANRKTRWGLIGLLAAGAAVGAAGAMFARRRRAAAAQWNQYEPGIDDIAFADAATDVGDGVVAATTKKVAAGAAAVAESVSTQAHKLADTLHEKTHTPTGASIATGASPPPAGASGRTSFSPPARPTATPTETAPTGATGTESRRSGESKPGATDESSRTLAGRNSGRSPFSSFANDDPTGNSPRS